MNASIWALLVGLPGRLKASDRRQIWRAAVNIGAAPPFPDDHDFAGNVLYFGYDVSARDGSTVGTLSDTGFRVGATRYSIGRLLAYNPYSATVFSGSFSFVLLHRDLSPAHLAALRLHVCDTAYDFNTEYVFTPENFYIENNQYPYLWRHGRGDRSGLYPDELDWGLLVDRTVYLSLPANTPATGNPTVTGTVRVGQVLTAATGTIADADGLTLADAGEAGFGYTYQWVRVDADGRSNPADIPGATGATYTVTASDAGKKLKVRVSFTDDWNSEEARESDGTVANSVPTASDGRVTALENQDYTFTAADFNYADADGDPLASVTIKVRPESGALKLDNANVRVDATVTRAQLDAGSLTYTPPTDQTGTGGAFFYFAVSDGAAESASVYTMTIDIAEDTIAPGRPRNLTAVPGNGAVALRWEAPLSPGSSAIVRYEVRHAAGDAVPPATAWESVGLTFTHPVTGLADGPHTFEVRAVNSSTPSESSAAEATATPSATLTPSVSMEEVEVRVAEDAGTAVVTVLLDRPSGAALTVPWYTADDTAVSPDDYIGGQGRVTFAPGETRNTISVRIVDDALREDPVDGRHEQFLVLPSRGDGYRLQNGGEALSVVLRRARSAAGRGRRHVGGVGRRGGDALRGGRGRARAQRRRGDGHGGAGPAVEGGARRARALEKQRRGRVWHGRGDDREHAHECASVRAGPAWGARTGVGRGGLGPWRTRDHAGERGHARGGPEELDGGGGCPGGAHGCRWARDRAAFRLPMDGDGLGRDRRAGGGGGHGEPRAADARGRGPDPRARRRRASQGSRAVCATTAGTRRPDKGSRWAADSTGLGDR